MSSPTPSNPTIPLPPNLYSQTLTTFDNLQSKGLLFYTPTSPEFVTDKHGFKFTIHTSSSFIKPILSPTSTSRHHASGPFSFPDPQFVLTPIGTTHLLQLNKFCMFRPSLILHPKEFREQTEDLDDEDVRCAWKVFGAMESGCDGDQRWMGFYNCGAQAGASQGHKHLQLLPRELGGLGKVLETFADGACEEGRLSFEEPTCLPEIPFKHSLIRLPKNASWQDVMGQYRKCLQKTKEIGEGSTAYNLLFVREWMIAVPRTSKGKEGVGANSAGMLGMVWVKNKEEREAWTNYGMSDYLRSLGVANGTLE